MRGAEAKTTKHMGRGRLDLSPKFGLKARLVLKSTGHTDRRCKGIAAPYRQTLRARAKKRLTVHGCCGDGDIP